MTDRISVEIEETNERERKQAEKDAAELNALRERMVVNRVGSRVEGT